jgi:hypothetical protein
MDFRVICAAVLVMLAALACASVSLAAAACACAWSRRALFCNRKAPNFARGLAYCQHTGEVNCWLGQHMLLSFERVHLAFSRTWSKLFRERLDVFEGNTNAL